MQNIYLIVVVGTTIWVGVDASSRDWSHSSFADRPWKWVVGCVVLWIVIFPVYLAKRGKAPQKEAVAHPVLPPEGSPDPVGKPHRVATVDPRKPWPSSPRTDDLRASIRAKEPASR